MNKTYIVRLTHDERQELGTADHEWEGCGL